MVQYINQRLPILQPVAWTHTDDQWAGNHPWWAPTHWPI